MKYLGIDFGLRRLGIAVSSGYLAAPLKTIKVKNLHDSIDKVAKVAKDVEVEKIIVGLPEGKLGKTVLGFINALKKSGFDVESVDETLSTKKAILKMIELGKSKNKRKVSDDIAAAIILQEWLDQ